MAAPQVKETQPPPKPQDPATLNNPEPSKHARDRNRTRRPTGQQLSDALNHPHTVIRSGVEEKRIGPSCAVVLDTETNRIITVIC